jgi:DNA/RNA-binding domain of Phe-tRNA-synthetase-like protein
MEFRHAAALRAAFPELSVGVIRARGPFLDASASPVVTTLVERARTRLAAGGEGEFPEIVAWRRAFSRMGLKPTQYRSASESLLRRLRQEGCLPAIHPAIDLANAVSVGFAVPIAVFDLERVEGGLEVRHATGDEVYSTFAGDEEHPEPGEVIFADAAGRAHARRWCNRQSGLSAIRPSTREVLIVAEAMHEGGAETVARLVETLAEALAAHGATVLSTALPTAAAPIVRFAPPNG